MSIGSKNHFPSFKTMAKSIHSRRGRYRRRATDRDRVYVKRIWDRCGHGHVDLRYRATPGWLHVPAHPPHRRSPCYRRHLHQSRRHRSRRLRRGPVHRTPHAGTRGHSGSARRSPPKPPAALPQSRPRKDARCSMRRSPAV